VAKHADIVLLEADTSRHKTSLTKELQAELLPFTAVATAFDDASWGQADDRPLLTFVEQVIGVAPTAGEADLKSRLERSESSEARSMAYEIANVASFTTLDRWTQRLMEKMNEPALPGYKPISFDQVLNADRALWVKVADATRSNLVGDPLATKPFDAAFERLSDHPEILCYIAPMPGSFQRPQHDSSTSVQKVYPVDFDKNRAAECVALKAQQWKLNLDVPVKLKQLLRWSLGEQNFRHRIRELEKDFRLREHELKSTMELEVQTGFSDMGVLDLLTQGVPLVGRKPRVIDDAKVSSLNLAYTSTVKLQLQVLDKSIMALLDILGWEFAANGDKAMPFCECFDALGARYVLTRIGQGTLELGNKAGRVEKLCSLLDVVASERKLSNHQASELQGLLNFASGFYLTKVLHEV
ncbi:unnamed protein product, partial [Effrenium voratum]